jgi:hypothetical protein
VDLTRQKVPKRVHHPERVERVEERGSHAPEGPRARGSAWECCRTEPARGNTFRRVAARGSPRRRVGAREARRQTGRMVPERVGARGSPWAARGSA